jgi:hypothetical protein
MARKMSALLLWLVALTGCSFLNVKEVKGPSGDDTFAGLKSLWNETNLSLVSILVVHGFGDHDVGYSCHLQNRIVKELQMDGICREPESIALAGDPCGEKQPIAGDTYGYIRICEYHDANQRRLRVYELTWSRLTHDLKGQYVGDDQKGQGRLWLNQTIKDYLLDQRFSDAVLYLGTFKAQMQKPIEYALCFMLNDPMTVKALTSQVEPAEACELFIKKPLAPQAQKDRAFVIITESLGSTMVWETLGALHSRPSTDPRHSVASEIVAHTRMTFMLANQLPLLRLGSVKDPPRSGSPNVQKGEQSGVFPPAVVDLLKDVARLRPLEVKKLDLIAFTDPNDLLGYVIPQELMGEAADFMRLVNVRISIAKLGWLFVYADAYKAHTGHIDNDEILNMIVCGAQDQC